MRKLILFAAMLGLLAPAEAAFAEETSCRGTIGSTTLDNVRVPDGASCTLNGTRVEGTVYVGTGSVLRAIDVHVIGNVQAEGSTSVTVRRGSFVGGSVQVVQGGRARVGRSEIGGNILFDENSGPLRARRNQIGADLQAFQNRGGVQITRNVIDGNLQCKENDPAPTGGGNVVQGNKEDQCSVL